MFGPGHAKTCLKPYANNKGAAQHSRSLISTFVVRCLNSMICILAISKLSRFYLASVGEQAGLNVTWSKISEDTFLRDVAHFMSEFDDFSPKFFLFLNMAIKLLIPPDCQCVGRMWPPQWLRMLIFSALNRSSSHCCGFVLSSGHMWEKPSSACGWSDGFYTPPHKKWQGIMLYPLKILKFWVSVHSSIHPSALSFHTLTWVVFDQFSSSIAWTLISGRNGLGIQMG